MVRMDFGAPSAFVATAALLLAGCDLPTEPPRFEQRWILPVEETAFAVDELLPDAVSTDGDAFIVSIDPVSAGETLGSLCDERCRGYDGRMARIPEFEGSYSEVDPLPDDLRAADVLGGSVTLEIHNGLSFDPLENGGLLTVSLDDAGGGAVLGRVTLDGDVDALPRKSTTTRTMPIRAGTVTGGLRTTVAFRVPGGQTGRIEFDDVFEVTATVESLRVGTITADVGGRRVELEEWEIALDDVDPGVAERITGGSVVLDVANPLAVRVDGAVVLGPTWRGFSIDGSRLSTVRIPYSGSELRALFGEEEVDFSGDGVASGTSVRLVPGQEIRIRATLDFTLEVG